VNNDAHTTARIITKTCVATFSVMAWARTYTAREPHRNRSSGIGARKRVPPQPLLFCLRLVLVPFPLDPQLLIAAHTGKFQTCEVGVAQSTESATRYGRILITNANFSPPASRETENVCRVFLAHVSHGTSIDAIIL
jgi:hypothetical protein